MVARWKGQPGTRRSPSDRETFDGKSFIVMELLELAFWEIGSNAPSKWGYCDEADYLETVYKEAGVVELIESEFGSGWPAIEKKILDFEKSGKPSSVWGRSLVDKDVEY